MWDLYLKSNEGIAIQTTFDDFIRSLEKSNKELVTGEVKYEDPEEMPEPEKIYENFIYKRPSFEHEREVRALHFDKKVLIEFGEEIKKVGHDQIDSYVKMLSDKISPPKGIRVDISLDTLIDNIYVSPTAGTWVVDLISSVVDTYKVDAGVEQSNLYEGPPIH